jgi:hypothetical protein
MPQNPSTPVGLRAAPRRVSRHAVAVRAGAACGRRCNVVALKEPRHDQADADPETQRQHHPRNRALRTRREAGKGQGH